MHPLGEPVEGRAINEYKIDQLHCSAVLGAGGLGLGTWAVDESVHVRDSVRFFTFFYFVSILLND